jgi:hypothetical protein
METNIAEIRFQQNTNVDFKIAITSGGVVGPTIQPNGLKIYCSCGSLELRPFWFMSGNHLHRAIGVPGYSDDQTTLDDDPRGTVDNGLKVLVAAQFDSLKITNRSNIQ